MTLICIKISFGFLCKKLLIGFQVSSVNDSSNSSFKQVSLVFFRVTFSWCFVLALKTSSSYFSIFLLSFITTWWPWGTITSTKCNQLLVSFSLTVTSCLLCLTFPPISTPRHYCSLILIPFLTYASTIFCWILPHIFCKAPREPFFWQHRA